MVIVIDKFRCFADLVNVQRSMAIKIEGEATG